MNKKTLSEGDICDKFIRPAMERAGWNGMDQIYREYPLRAGRMVVRGRQARRDATTVLRADYALFYKINIPLAVVEAKDNNQSMGAGMTQAINYGKLLEVPFCFTSNGDGFVFRDATLADGILERNLSLDEFPSPADLWARYCDWKGWTDEIRTITESEYSPSKIPRYYQLNAINRTVEAIAGGQDRVLLVMATGTGKRIKEQLLAECNLHTVVRLPNGVFAPYTGIKTNLLFFTKGRPTEAIWYYEHPYPVGVKSYNKTKPIRIEEFDAEKAWWGSKADGFAGWVENERAWKVSIDQIKAANYNLDQKNPHAADVVSHDPEVLLADYAKLTAEAQALRDQLKAILAESLSGARA